MGTLIVALKTVAPLFLVISLGAVFSRSKVCTPAWIEVLNKYALYIGFPALVIASLMPLETGENSFIQLIIHTSVYNICCMLLAFPVAKLLKLKQSMLRTLFLILPFGNIAYLGIPVLQNAFGDAILPVAAIISAVYLFWLLTLGIILVEAYGEEQTSIKKLSLSLAKNPLLLSVFIGVAIVVFNLKLPNVVEQTINIFANSVTAVVLFALGIFLGKQEIGKLRDWYTVSVMVVTTMLFLPFVFYLYLKAVGLDSELTQASIIDAAMPLGLTPYVLTVQYNLKSKLAARIVVLGTILSVFIIPLWMVWLNI
ncbi:AEC family transporter [uncultured Draconibacterium sp.]|uniref:AEC family transporter n=1 Tax=uncultured Draconibacterium sp. TaxID=1573823 RepID=UPI0032619464